MKVIAAALIFYFCGRNAGEMKAIRTVKDSFLDELAR